MEYCHCQTAKISLRLRYGGCPNSWRRHTAREKLFPWQWECVYAFLPNYIYRVPKYSITQSLHLYNPFRCRDLSQLIGMLVICHRVEYFLFGDWHTPSAFPQRHWLYNYCIHSSGEYIKLQGVESLPRQLTWGQNSTWWLIHYWSLHKMHSA